jgi:hypothetical protein
MSNEQRTLTDLEDRLAGEQGAAVRQHLLRDMAALKLRLATRLTRGAGKDDFAAMTATRDAVHAAERVLQNWVPGTALGARGGQQSVLELMIEQLKPGTEAASDWPQ